MKSIEIFNKMHSNSAKLSNNNNIRYIFFLNFEVWSDGEYSEPSKIRCRPNMKAIVRPIFEIFSKKYLMLCFLTFKWLIKTI